MTFATYGEHNPQHVQQHTLLSLLYHKFRSFTYFIPSYETCSINVNSLFHAAIKNLHIKANGIFIFLLLHPPLLTTTISEGITHTCKNTFLCPKVITNKPLAIRSYGLVKLKASVCIQSIQGIFFVNVIYNSQIFPFLLLKIHSRIHSTII